MSHLFVYHALAKRLSIPSDRIGELEASVRGQYGRDDMMFELRMLRTLRAIGDGVTTLDEAISEFGTGPVWESVGGE